MKIFGKKIGNKFLSIFWNGKPKTIEPKDEAEMNEISENLRKSSTGDKEAIEKLENMLFKDEKERLAEENESQKIAEVQTLKDEVSEIEKAIEINAKYSETLKSDLFEVIIDEKGSEKVYLKGFKAEIPPILIDKFVEEIASGRDIQPLINFWKLNLTNENAEARRGLYNFIKKQRLIITKHGYFIAFRNVLNVKSKNGETTYNRLSINISKDYLDVVDGFVAKVKKQRKGLRSFYVIKNGNELSLKSVNTQKYEGEKIGYLKDVYEYLKNTDSVDKVKDDVEIFTDQHTRKMVIKIGEPVRIPREKCDKDAKVECSFGLHVGSQKFVSNGGFGDTTIAVLVNPQHVISVPYSDAHKMRVCEYFPFMKLTRSELLDFHKLDPSIYSSNYHRLEKKKMEKVLNVLDTLNDEERKEFKSNIKNLVINTDELESKKQFIKENSRVIENLLGDDISKSLDYDEIRNIIQSRMN